MKKIFTLCTLSLFVLSRGTQFQEYKNSFEMVKKVSEIFQKASDELSTENCKQPTRAVSHKSYFLKLVEKLQEEINQILENEKDRELSLEEKQIVQLLEAYVDHFRCLYEH